MKAKLKILIAAAIILPAIYLFSAYTTLDPIAKYRDLYIETAMSTMTHQYLAKIFPQSVIDRVMKDTEEQFEENKVVKSLPLDQADFLKNMVDRNHESRQMPEPAASLEDLLVLFPDLDISTLEGRVDVEDLNNLDIEDPDFEIRTIQGDTVYAINVPEQIMIVNIRTSSYDGKLALSKHPENLILGKNRKSGRGETITEMCADYDAILGINASGFYDPGGHGSGDTPVGLVISQGEISGTRMYDRYQIAGMDIDNNFVVGTDLDLDRMRDAMQFYPMLISENQKQSWGSFGMGIQPRTCIGQSVDGDIMLLIIDGRQVGHSIGITVQECADILLRYNCYIAMNMDGGSSASMTYKGKMITKTSSPQAGGRYLPDAWLVLRQNQESEE